MFVSDGMKLKILKNFVKQTELNFTDHWLFLLLNELITNIFCVARMTESFQIKEP